MTDTEKLLDAFRAAYHFEMLRRAGEQRMTVDEATEWADRKVESLTRWALGEPAEPKQ